MLMVEGSMFCFYDIAFKTTTTVISLRPDGCIFGKRNVMECGNPTTKLVITNGANIMSEVR